VSLIVGGLGLMLAIPGAIIIIAKIVPTISAAPLTTPVTVHRQLEHGTYLVYERLSAETGLVMPGDVTVTADDGVRVPTGFPSNSEHLTLDGDRYTGVVAFDTPHAGRYEIDITTSTPTRVAINRSLVDTFSSIVVWVLLTGAGGLMVTVGVIMLIVGAVRRGRAQRAGYAYAGAGGPPPGWYPNPDGSPSQRWWDGARWSDYTNPPH
jgi:hypothetical protein